MRTLISKIALTLTLLITLSISGNAQTTYLRNIETSHFNKIQVSLDTEAIVMKSKRNHVTLVGDSSYIAGLPVLVEGEILEINYNSEPNNMLNKVVIEYTNIDHATTGGTGTYYFHNIEEESLVVFNPYANVILSGTTQQIRVVSQQGTTDVTALTSTKEVMHIGETALLVGTKPF